MAVFYFLLDSLVFVTQGVRALTLAAPGYAAVQKRPAV